MKNIGGRKKLGTFFSVCVFFLFLNKVVQVLFTHRSSLFSLPAEPPSTCPESGEGFSGLLSCNLLGVEVSEESRQPVVGLAWGLQVQPGQPFLQQVFLERKGRII